MQPRGCLWGATPRLTGRGARLPRISLEIGSLPDEAYARLRAGEGLLADDRPSEAEAELEQALAFYRHVGATAYAEEAEVLLAAARVD